MRHKLDTDREMLRLAEQQHGVVARRQLLALGLSAQTIARRAQAGRLVRVGRGVYALGHRALRPKGHWMTAVLVCGERAVLSHRSAARLWGLRPWSSAPRSRARPCRLARRPLHGGGGGSSPDRGGG